jgi:hypothetical protein
VSRVMSSPESSATAAPTAAPVTMAAALNRALADSLAADERVVVFGEDVGSTRRWRRRASSAPRSGWP